MKRRVGEAADQRLYDAAVTRLAQCGYGYDARLCDGDELLGFGKPLGDDVHAIVQLQRRGAAWTINLLRVKAAELSARVYGGYADALGARLSHVLWFVAKVRDGGQPDRWWPLDEIETALDLLIEHGLPWLENSHAPKPWEMPAQNRSELLEAVRDIAGPELLERGYKVVEQSVSSDFPYPYFVKSLPDDQFGLIEFQSCYSLDPAYFMFDVRLQRKSTDNPLDFGGSYEEWRSASLGQLVWQQRGALDESWSVDAVKTILWQYADRVELAARLREALGAIDQWGTRWLEGDLRVDGAADTI